jgi:mRNA-degrading endonuclease toxin of MazEF toxin-antitoxin module
VFRINQTTVNQEIGRTTAKSTRGSQEPVVNEEFKKMTWNVIDEVGHWDVYNMGQWVKNIDRWSSTKGKTYTTRYHRGDILMVDFGSVNYGFEFSYEHPCVVLVERKHHLLVVPGSTKKYNSPFPEYYDVTPSDGFARNTGILLEQMRWIHKNRVVTNTGRTASQQALDAIEEFILSYVELHKTRIADKNQEIRRMRARDFNLNQQNEQQSTELQQLQQDYDQLESSHKRLKLHYERLKKEISKVSQVILLLQSVQMEPSIKEELEKLTDDLRDLEQAQ